MYTKNNEVDNLMRIVQIAGLNAYALLGKYKKVCGVSRLEDQVIIDTCNSFIKYLPKIKGKHWPYFIKILHSNHQTFKPQDTVIRGGTLSISDIIKKIMKK